MLTGREQSAALRFTVRRRVTALTRGLSDGYADATLPKERSLVLGMVITVLAAGAVMAHGWFGGPRTEPLPRDGTVLLAGTGSYLVMIDGIAHPALNTASALLAADSVTTVDPESLEDAPRGAPMGIPGAPDTMAPASALTGQPWAVCVMPGASAHRPAVVVGGGRLPALATHQALVLAEADGSQWLAVSGRRHAVSPDVLIALGISPGGAVPAPAALLDLLEVGTPLESAEVPEQVQHVVRRTTPAGTTYLAAVSGGLAPITPLAAAVLADGPVTEASGAPSTATVTVPKDWPGQIPQALDLTDLIGCASSTSGELSALSGVPADSSLIDDADAPSAVIIAPATGALVRIPSEPRDSYLLVTDSGRAYAIADDIAVRRLGYDPSRALNLPAAAYALLPRGPDLSTAAATTAPP